MIKQMRETRGSPAFVVVTRCETWRRLLAAPLARRDPDARVAVAHRAISMKYLICWIGAADVRRRGRGIARGPSRWTIKRCGCWDRRRSDRRRAASVLKQLEELAFPGLIGCVIVNLRPYAWSQFRTQFFVGGLRARTCRRRQQSGRSDDAEPLRRVNDFRSGSGHLERLVSGCGGRFLVRAKCGCQWHV